MTACTTTVIALFFIVSFCAFQDTVRLLAKCGMNVDALTGAKFGNVSPLMLAAMKGHLGVVKALVELGASPDKKGKFVNLVKKNCFSKSSNAFICQKCSHCSIPWQKISAIFRVMFLRFRQLFGRTLVERLIKQSN